MRETHGEYLASMEYPEVMDMFRTIAEDAQWPELDGDRIDPLCILALAAGILSNENQLLSLVVAYAVGYVQSDLNSVFLDLATCKDAVSSGDMEMALARLEEMKESMESWNGEAIISEV